MQPQELKIRKVVLENELLFQHVYEMVRSGHTVSFNVKGYSMTPFLIHCRDSVMIANIEPSHLKPGDIILGKTTFDRIVLHRVIAVSEKSVTLKGDGNFWGTEQVLMENVAGIARSVVRNGHTISCDNTLWVFFSLIWRHLGPIRIILLKILRRIYYSELYEKKTGTDVASTGK